MRKAIAPFVIGMCLVLAVFAGVNAQTFWSTMDNVIMRSLIVTGTTQLSGATSVAGTLTGASANFTSGISTDGSVVAYGASSVGTFLALTPGTTQVINNGGSLTPVSSNQPVSSSVAAGTSDIGATAAGTILRIVNVGSQTITFTDTGTLRLSADIVLGQYDSLMLMSAGVGQGYIQMGTSNN